MTSVRTPAIAAGQPSPCHPGSRLSGTASALQCDHCGALFDARATEPFVVQAEEDLVTRRAAARAHDLELERAQHTPETSRFAPVSAREAAAHRKALAEVMSP